MLNSLDLNPSHGYPGKVAKEYSAQSIAQGSAKAFFQWLSSEASKVIGTFNALNIGYSQTRQIATSLIYRE